VKFSGGILLGDVNVQNKELSPELTERYELFIWETSSGLKDYKREGIPDVVQMTLKKTLYLRFSVTTLVNI
jgi:hypothetical protein